LTDKGQLSEHIYGLLKAFMSDSEGIAIKNVVLTSDNLEVVALLDNSCFIVPSELKDAKLEKVGWTTALFASLGYEMIISDPVTDAIQKIKRAWKNAHDHSGVKLPDVLRPPSNTDASKKGSSSNDWSEKWQPTEWVEIDRRWKAAQRGIGIINKNGRTLELWRAKTDLPDYVVCEKNKRETIQRIWRVVSNFKVRPDKNIGILLEADPGVGKSYLAEKLANQLKLPFIKNDISQMVEREDLLNFFDIIAARQAEEDSSIFVFVDEINATLGGSPVYGGFLTPLEAGKYMRQGRLCELKPCIWMFAGTPEKSADKEKMEDFRSRLTVIEQIGFRSLQERYITLDLKRYFLTPSEVIKKIDENGDLVFAILDVFPSVIQNCRLDKYRPPRDPLQERVCTQLIKELSKNEKVELMLALKDVISGEKAVFNPIIKKIINLDHHVRLEQVYMGAQWINDAFNDVQKIDRDILSFFYLLDPSKAPARNIKRLASSLENIQYGRAHKGNCTSDLWRRTFNDLFGSLDQYESWKNKIERRQLRWVYIQLD
jgi:hypothetical protein